MNEYDLYLEEVYLDIYEEFGSSAVSDPAYADYLRDVAMEEAHTRVLAPVGESYLYPLPPF